MQLGQQARAKIFVGVSSLPSGSLGESSSLASALPQEGVFECDSLKNEA